MPEETTEHGQWTVETLREYILALMDSYDTKTQAMIAGNDIKYLERFEASQIAAGIAFTAQQTAMLTALTAQKLAVDTALAAADRAGTKDQVASEKRFEALNELRQMVTDQQTTFIQRVEAAALFKSTDDKIAAMQSNYSIRHDALVNDVNALRGTISSMSGKSAGMSALWSIIVAAGGLLIGIGGLLVALFLK